MTTPRTNTATGAGSTTAGLVAGGNPSATAATEEWNNGVLTKTFTDS